ncbi:unnamed protein product [Ectocarpus sp. CCAP 1310/34]|nr:unnamed protein product [Ectocarpus sp. CCAP 1310/34]
MTSASSHKDEVGIAAYIDGRGGPRMCTIVSGAPVPTQLHHYARLAAGAPQQEGAGPLRVSLALLAVGHA